MPSDALNEQSGEDAASLAGKALRNPSSLTPEEIKSLAGSVLSQSKPIPVFGLPHRIGRSIASSSGEHPSNSTPATGQEIHCVVHRTP